VVVGLTPGVVQLERLTADLDRELVAVGLIRIAVVERPLRSGIEN